MKALNYNYFFKSIVYTTGVITNQLKDSEIALGGAWKHRIAGIDLSADLMVNVLGDLDGNLFNASAKYTVDDDKTLEAGISFYKD